MRAQSVVTIAHAAGAQARESIVHLGHRDGTMRDVHQLMNVAPIESDDIVFRMDGDAVAIRVRQRRRDHRPHGWFCDATDPPHRLLDLSRLQLELMRIADVLIAAPAASTEVRTFRRDAMWRKFDQLD